MIKLMGTTRIPMFSGEKLRVARETHGWSRGRLGIAVGKSTTSVAAWERGLKHPTPAALTEIADALDVKPADLLSLPRSEWGLAEFRVVHGWEQKDVSAHPDLIPPIAPSLLSHIEATYQRPTAVQAEALGALYGITADEIQAAWERARERVLAAS